MKTIELQNLIMRLHSEQDSKDLFGTYAQEIVANACKALANCQHPNSAEALRQFGRIFACFRGPKKLENISIILSSWPAFTHLTPDEEKDLREGYDPFRNARFPVWGIYNQKISA